MSGWAKVRWTQARQVARLMGIDEADAPAEAIAPSDHFDALRAGGALDDALSFVGHALPRYEGVQWAEAAVARIAGAAPRTAAETRAIEAVRAWIADPDDARRRAAFEAGEQAPSDSPARLLALAVFFSGGSLAPDGIQAVNPPTELSGRFAATAVLVAAHRTDDPATGMAQALDAGDRLARGAA